MTRIPFCLLLTSVLFLSGCNRDSAHEAVDLPRLDRLEGALRAGAAGAFGAEDGPAAIHGVMGARLTPDGARIVVLDRSPPFLKVFARDGSLVAALVERGGGPSEILGAADLVVNDSSALLVEPGFLGVFPLSGQAGAKLRVPFRLLALGRDCDGRLVGYGPQGQSPAYFVHALEPDSSAVQTVASAGPGEAPRTVSSGFGGSEIIGGPAGSLVRHRVDGLIVPLHFACSGEVTDRAWHWAVAGFATARSAPETGVAGRRDGAIGLTVDGVTPTNAGIAELPAGELLWIERRPPSDRGAAGEAGQHRTEWFLADSAGIFGGFTTGGRYQLQDVAAGWVLLSASEPWPHVLLISVEQLLDLLRQGRRTPRR
jgi:hypothetical protein